MTENDKRKYMSLAIDVMRESVYEKRDDGKISPKVGALLVLPDNTVCTACRGELRDGDHAEFTVIERKNRHKNLTGSVLFATLEPCAPGARKAPKLSCSERIVNARVSEVYIGIEDPDPTVATKGIKYIQSRGIKVNMFDKEFQKIIKDENSEFLTQALHRAEEIEEKGTNELLDNNISDNSLEILSDEALIEYANAANIDISENYDKLISHLKKLGMLNYDNDKYDFSKVCVLLFAKNPREYIPQAVIKVKTSFGIKDLESHEDFSGPLVLIPKKIEEWYTKTIPWIINRSESKREKSQLLDYKPIREAIVNAIVHRDYEIEGAKIYLEIFSDKVVVRSPGLPINPITLEQLVNFKAPSLARNPKIAYVFNVLGLMEENRFGMDTFISMPEKYSLPVPVFNYEDPYLNLTFSLIMNEDKTDLEYNYIKENVEVSREQFGEHFGYDVRKAQRQIKKLIELGLIITNGESTKSSKLRYKINYNKDND